MGLKIVKALLEKLVCVRVTITVSYWSNLPHTDWDVLWKIRKTLKIPTRTGAGI